MHSARDIAFSAIIGCLLFVVLGSLLLGPLLGTQAPTRSYLEGRNYQQFPQITTQSVGSGTFQDEFEQFAADAIPARDSVLLFNAATQRTLIECANALFRYDVYPTFYSSEYLVDASAGTLLEAPYPADEFLPNFKAGAQAIGALSADYPKLHVTFALANRSATDAASPAIKLSAGMATYQDFKAAAVEELPANCTFVDLESIKPSVQGEFFTTDHHWQVQGAVAAYQRIIAALGRTPIAFGGFSEAYPGPFYGSLARSGLYTAQSDVLYDVDYAHGDIKVTADGKKQGTAFLDAGWGDGSFQKKHEFSNVYAEYFHTDYGLLTFQNKAAQEGTLLIIGDSFTNNMDRFFAENYRTVHVLDPRHYEGSVRDFLAEHEVDDVLFLLGANNIANPSVAGKLA